MNEKNKGCEEGDTGTCNDKNYIWSSEVAWSCHKETKGSKIIFQEQSYAKITLKLF